MAAPAKQTHSRLSFISFTTFIDPIFWNEVNRLKVNDWQLNDSPRPVHSNFTIHGAQPSDSLLCFDQDSLTDTPTKNLTPAAGFCSIKGTFHLLNTKKSFLEDLDRRKMLEDFAQSIWQLIISRKWLENPELLNFFYLTAYADVKRYIYYFWNCVPALVFPDNIRLQQSLDDLNDDMEVNIQIHTCAWDHSTKTMHSPFLLVNNRPTKLTELISLDNPKQFILVFPNPSEIHAKFGWTIRNLLAAIAYLRPEWTSLRIMGLTRQFEFTFISTIVWDQIQPEMLEREPRCVGWERTSDDKLTYRNVDLKFMFDPIKIMEQTVDLNLKLIRWRQAPSINLERFTSLRVLLVGSGTLGCNIARALLGWGVRNFTFIDHAFVSYNNPIRQSLFTFEDCYKTEGGSTPKAVGAAAALKRIYPLVEAKGLNMKVPMPGYPFSSEETEYVRKQICLLEDTIRQCDVLFLVMDSRESRWLPTLLASIHNKLAITVALGFDDFMIIRHGTNPVKEQADCNSSQEVSSTLSSLLSTKMELPGSLLGCYFCNDMTAPGNSTSERALDQQCTITRSGISQIASGFATELLASLLQHELCADAPACLDENSTLLGATPHQIRGFLSRFHQMTPTIRRFDQCTACGQKVLQTYRAEGFTFLDRVFKDPTELERLTGLTELQQQADELQEGMIELDDNESISSI